MSKLDSLIQKFCPKGVEYDKLKNVTVMLRGTSLVKSNAVEGPYPVISGGREPAFYHNTFNRVGETITVAGSGAGAGFVQFWSTPIFVNDAFSIQGKDGISTRFIYHCLTNLQDQISATKTGGGVPHVHISNIADFLVPVPPLPVQREIVQILDKFTELTAELTTELTAELTARKKQYEFYRDELLGEHSWPMEKLGNACKLKAGKAIASSLISPIKDPSHSIVCYGANGFRGYVQSPNRNGNHCLIGRQGALCGNVCFASGEFYATEHAIVVTNGKLHIERYLYHLFVKMNLNQYKSQGAQPGLSVAKLEELEIPIPPLPEQRRIVSILDRFDAVCNDLTAGLPAEIEARRKQYEYYRDKLLSFERAE